MSRTIVDIDGELLARAQRALRTATAGDTINAALALAAAIDAEKRTQMLDSYRALLDRLDVDLR